MKTYAQFFAERGLQIPAQYQPYANALMTPEAEAQLSLQFPVAPVAPAPAAVPPAAVPPAPAVAAAPVANTGFNREDSWPSVFVSIDDIRAAGGEVLDLHDPIPSKKHPGMMMPRALVHMKFGSTPITAMAFTSTKRDANNNVIGYLSIEECSQVQVSEDPRMAGKYALKLTPASVSEAVMAKATVAKTKPSINWAQFAAAANVAD